MKSFKNNFAEVIHSLTVKAKRTNCLHKADCADVEIKIEAYTPSWRNEVCIKISKGGVTGYESAFVSGLFKAKHDCRERGWCACAGTERQWDTLFVPAESMQEIYNWLKELNHVDS